MTNAEMVEFLIGRGWVVYDCERDDRMVLTAMVRVAREAIARGE